MTALGPSRSRPRPRIAYLCMESVFSVRPLEALLGAGHDVVLVMRPLGGIETRKKPVLRRHRGFDVNVRRALGLPNEDDESRNPFVLAQKREIPAWLVGNASAPAVQRLFAKERIDLVVIAFFNQLLRRELLAIPKLGTVNLHPSLLPRYRGPAPLFWTFRDGCDETGLTVHRVSPGEDDGDVLGQAVVPLLGARGEDVVDELSARACDLVVDVVDAITDRREQPRAQRHDDATRAPRPTDADLLVDRTLGARRLFSFARGVGRWNAIHLDVNGERFRVMDGIEIDTTRHLPGDHLLVGEELHVGCDDGVVTLHVRNR